MFKEELILILLKLFPQIEADKVTVTLIPKSHKELRRKEDYRPISLIRYKIFNKILLN